MRIGILGGTFDPPHYAHLMIAEEVLETCSLDQVWFMPSPSPPHKTEEVITPATHRIEMVKKAIAGNGRFSISLVEFEREGLSYTYDTMKVLTHSHPHVQFSFIVGADMVEDLPNWDHARELVQLVDFIGVGRPGFSVHSMFNDSIHEVDVPAFEISASFLRERFRKNQNTRYYLPDVVRNYIEEKKLYG